MYFFPSSMGLSLLAASDASNLTVTVRWGDYAITEILADEERDYDATTVWQRYKSVFSDRVFIGVLIIGGMTFSGLFSYLSSSSFLFQGLYTLSPQEYGMLFAINSLGVVLGVQAASRLAARYGPQWVMAWSTAIMLVAARR